MKKDWFFWLGSFLFFVSFSMGFLLGVKVTSNVNEKKISLLIEERERLSNDNALLALQTASLVEELERCRNNLEIWNLVTSWYGSKHNGRKTASGEIFNENLRTGATWKFDFNTHLLLLNPKTGKFSFVRINDRGPDSNLKRDLDVSKKVASELGFIDTGVETLLAIRMRNLERD